MKFNLHIWRQKNKNSQGVFVDYLLDNVDEDDSFLEMLDLLNEQLIENNEDAISFDYDCREGICGTCGLVINGYPHGEKKLTTTCQLYMRDYKNNHDLWIEPFRAKSFPIIKDLVVDRTSMDEIMRAGGYISTHTGNSPEANGILVDKKNADTAFDAATCIGCGACIAVCTNASATLFVAAKISHLNHLPQGKIESKVRKKKMLSVMHDKFGSCSNHKHCEAVCPKKISLSNISHMNSI